MRGLSEEDVKRFIRAHNIDEEYNWIARALLDECHELDTWLPIDENTPKDRTLWLYDDCGIHGEGYYSDLFNKFVYLTDKYDPINATHWQELPEDPTCENSADT